MHDCCGNSCRRVLCCVPSSDWFALAHVVAAASDGTHVGALQGAHQLSYLASLPHPHSLPLQICTIARMGEAMRVIGKTFGGRYLISSPHSTPAHSTSRLTSVVLLQLCIQPLPQGHCHRQSQPPQRRVQCRVSDCPRARCGGGSSSSGIARGWNSTAIFQLHVFSHSAHCLRQHHNAQPHGPRSVLGQRVQVTCGV